MSVHIDLTLRCPTCGRRADMCFDHGDDWKKRRMTVADDFNKIRDALIVLAGHLPLFSDDIRRRSRADEHLRLQREAFNALDRLADKLERSANQLGEALRVVQAGFDSYYKGDPVNLLNAETVVKQALHAIEEVRSA